MIHVHELGGCAAAPLAHYLKALGVLRLVAEQRDRDVRGWWEGGHYRLATELTREDLERFFLEDYQPTPMFNPWGARSGYFDGGSEKSARESLKRIECSKISRLKPFSETIRAVRAVISDITDGSKPKDKDELVLALRRKSRNASSLWIDTVISVIGAGDNISLAQPPIFGTGGSEGSGGYPSAYMSAIVEVMIENDWSHAIHSALFGENEHDCYWEQSMGQFAPSGSSTPWDMLFAFEGACMLRSSVAGRASTNSQKWMSSPFYVAPRSTGYTSGSRLDEKFLHKGKEYPGRGEQWFPIWGRPSRFSEVQQIFLQGRAATKAGRATDGWTMARAISSFGVGCGIPEFIRYGYQQRNNQATHFAIPIGRFRVPDRRPATSSCLDDLDQWLPSLHRVAYPADDRQAKTSPARLTGAYRRLKDSLFSVLQEQATPQQWQDVLLRLSDMEAAMRYGSGLRAQPVPRLRPEWVAAGYDGTPEFRLALAFALQSGVYRVGGRRVEDHVRRHWLPLERKRPQLHLDPERKPCFSVSGTGPATKLDVPSEVVMHGRCGLDDAVALLERRLLEASQREGRHLPLEAALGTAARVPDLADLVADFVDLDRTLVLARAMMALDRKKWVEPPAFLDPPSVLGWPDDAWLAIRLCLLPWPLRMPSGFELDIGADPAIVRRLAAGDATAAVDIALRRLRAAGVCCTIRMAAASPKTARLWAAALAFPISQKTAKRLLSRLDSSKE